MRGNNHLNNRPYIPFNRAEDKKKPYICRIAPDCDGFEFEWFDNFCDGEHTLYYKKREDAEYNKVSLSNAIYKITGLQNDCDYEFYIESKDGYKSNLRFVRTADIPDGTTVINYLHPDDDQYAFSGKYICSPSLVRLQSGRLIAGMDLYGHRMAQNLMILFYSDDDGKNWRYLTDLYPFYWGNLFVHNNELYVLGLSTEYGNLQIAKSCDGGITWSAPTVIFYGSNVLCSNGGMHRAPMQMVEYNGRIYTTCEYGCWDNNSHLPAVMSIDKNDDLMVAENWVCTGFLSFDGQWAKDADKQGDTMEGNIIPSPDGKLYNILRWKVGEYLKMEIDTDNPEKLLTYKGIIDAPVSNSMFRIFKRGDKYYMITNRKTEKSGMVECWTYRNVLSLFVSSDLENWELVRDIINCEEQDANKIGFQYPTFIAEKDGVSLVIRSGFGGSHSCHDSNYMLFTTLDI